MTLGNKARQYILAQIRQYSKSNNLRQFMWIQFLFLGTKRMQKYFKGKHHYPASHCH